MLESIVQDCCVSGSRGIASAVLSRRDCRIRSTPWQLASVTNVIRGDWLYDRRGTTWDPTIPLKERSQDMLCNVWSVCMHFAAILDQPRGLPWQPRPRPGRLYVKIAASTTVLQRISYVEEGEDSTKTHRPFHLCEYCQGPGKLPNGGYHKKNPLKQAKQISKVSMPACFLCRFPTICWMHKLQVSLTGTLSPASQMAALKSNSSFFICILNLETESVPITSLNSKLRSLWSWIFACRIKMDCKGTSHGSQTLYSYWQTENRSCKLCFTTGHL